MFRYRAFGLTIASEIRFDELSPAAPYGEASVDIQILRRDLCKQIPPLGHPTHIDFESDEGVEMMWPGAAMVRIKSSTIIHVQPYHEVPIAYLAFPILGPVMGWLLHMRGLFVMHGSAVKKNAQSVAFVGDKTAGKSTTACAFLKNGWSLLTDDLLALDVSNGCRPKIQPAFGQLKLNADTLDADIPGAHILPLVMEGFQKRQYRLAETPRHAVPVGSIFILERGGERPSITWLGSGDAISALFRYSYNQRFVDAPFHKKDRSQQFHQAVAIADNARVGRLRVPHDRNRLDETVALIETVIGEGPI